jgi:hypothetical protein
MSESRFRRSISQERMTEGWKGERNCMQKTTVGTVDIKTSLGGEKKGRERESRDTQTKEMCGLRVCKGQGAKSRSRTAQAPPWVMGQGLSMMQVLYKRGAQISADMSSCAWREAVNKGGVRVLVAGAAVVGFSAELKAD